RETNSGEKRGPARNTSKVSAASGGLVESSLPLSLSLSAGVLSLSFSLSSSPGCRLSGLSLGCPLRISCGVQVNEIGALDHSFQVWSNICSRKVNDCPRITPLQVVNLPSTQSCLSGCRVKMNGVVW